MTNNTYISQIDGRWYAYAANASANQVYSIGSDTIAAKQQGCRCYCAKWTDDGIKYVSSPSPTKNAAIARARRAGDYQGEV